MKKFSKQLNYGQGKIEIAFNEGEGPAEIMICEDIGKDPWTGEGLSVKDIKATLDSITPRGRELHFMTNSRGGDVAEGKSIRALLNEWPGKIVNTVIGVAASTASWCIPADEVRAYKASQLFVHRAWAAITIVGNSKDVAASAKDAISFLETTDDQIAEIYSDDTGKTKEEMLALMDAETLLTGQKALELGLVDTLIDGTPLHNFSDGELNVMKQKLAALNSLKKLSGPNEKQGSEEQTKNAHIVMNKEQMIALLNKWGVTIPANATDEQLIALINAGPKPAPAHAAPAAPAPAQNHIIKNGDTVVDISELQNELKEMRNQRAASRRASIRNQLQVLVNEDKIPAAAVDGWLQSAYDAQDDPVKGNPVLNQLAALPPKAPGVDPLNSPAMGEFNRLEVTSADIKDIARGFEAFNDATKAWQRGASIGMDVIRNSAIAKANFFRKFENRLVQVFNTNTIATELKRQVILQGSIRDFVRRLLTLSMFSTVHQNIPLEGTNKVSVPFYDLDTSASTAFVSGTGYTTIGNTTTDQREITIGEGATNGDRLYQALSFSSQEIARQPYLNIAELTKLKAEKLASDIVADVLSIITNANFGAAAITSVAELFDSDDIADLKYACRTWPELGRSLMLDSAYDANLLKDPAFKHALNAASDSAIKEGRLFPRVMGFDYTENPNIPSNSENLVGFAVFKSAILFATAPVPAVEEVRNAGTVWEMVTDPQTGISFEYRRFGNNVTDAATNVIECSYGFAKGNGNALKRIVSAAV